MKVKEKKKLVIAWMRPDTRQRLRVKATKEGKTLVQFLEDLSK
jgi:hypothetical protein